MELCLKNSKIICLFDGFVGYLSLYLSYHYNSLETNELLTLIVTSVFTQVISSELFLLQFGFINPMNKA